MSKRYPYLFLGWLLLISIRAFPQATDKPLFTFGLMTDVQYCDCDNAGSRHFRSSPKKLEEAVQTFNQEKVEFVVHLGDFIDHDYQSFAPLNRITKHLKPRLYHVLGNHDFSVKQDELKSAQKALGLKKRYYAFSRDNWRFIFLDTNDLSIYGNPKGSPIDLEANAYLEKMKSQNAPNAKTWNGGVSVAQLSWLQTELDAAKSKNEKVLLFAHHPITPIGDAHNAWNDQSIKTLIGTYPNVFGYFHGHVHEKRYFNDNGVHHVTFKGIVEKEDNAYSIIEVHPTYLKINGYATEDNRLLK